MTMTPSGMNNRGLSFIEILLAMGLLTTLMIPVMMTFSASSSGIQMTSEELIAHSAAIELLEQTMSVPFQFLPTGEFSDSQIQNEKKLDEQSPLKLRISLIKGLEVQRKMKITPLLKDARVRFKKVEIEVSWATRDTRASRKSVSVKGLLANETN